MNSRLYVGVDGGATKTLAVAADEKGIVIGAHEKGPSNYHIVGLDRAVDNINAAIEGALASARVRVADVVVLGLAGMDTSFDFKVFEERAVPRILGRRIFVRHDAEIALVGATLGQPGVILIAGTGSVAGARNRRGEYARCGGWGHLVGDEGSAYYIASEALRAVLWAYDGRGEATALTARILEALKISSPDEILRKLYVEKMSVSDVAKLAPIVTELAKAGDPVARRIVEEAAKQLALHVMALIRKLNMKDEQPIKVAPVGGVFKAGDVILEPFKRNLEKHFKVELIRPQLPPVAGALLLAYILDGVEVGSRLIDNIREGLKERGLLS